MKRLMMLSALVALVAPAFAAASYEWTGSGRANDWTDENNYDPVGNPGEGDTVVIPADTTVTLSSTDAASWQVTDRLAKINPSTDTSVVEIDVPSGTKALKCGVANGKQKGLLVKKGNGLLQLDRYDNPSTDYYVSLRIEEGTLRAPTNNSATSSTVYSYGDVEVGTNATFFAAMCGNNVTCPLTMITSLTGSGVVTNDTTYKFGGHFMVVGDGPECTFDGTIGGRIRFVSDAKVKLTGTNSTMFASNNDVMSAGNNMGRFENGPMVSFVKLGNRGEPSSVGSGDMQFYSRKADDSAGMFRYLGTGETSDKDFTLCGQALYPSLLDAGPNGGLTLTGAFKISTSKVQNHALILAGDNAAEAGVCTLAGPIADVEKDGATYAITNIVKRGAGTWRFADNAKRTWSGALTVESGTVRFDSYAPIGEVCSLGTAANAKPYPVMLKGGVLEYTGNAPLETAGRPIAVEGEAQIRVLNADERTASLAGVTAAGAGATLVLESGTGETNRFSALTGAVSVRKTGAGLVELTGEQTFSGDLSVEAGEVLITVPRYEWYEVTFRHTVSNQLNFGLYEFALYDKDGRRQNGGLVCPDDIPFADLKRGEATWNNSMEYNNVVDFYKMFDDDATLWKTYQKSNGKSTGALSPDAPATWVTFMMRLSGDAHLVTSFDTVVGTTKYPDPLARSIDDYLLRASVDGITWDTICSTNKSYQPLTKGVCQWFFPEVVYEKGDAEHHMTGCPIPARPESLPDMLSNCRVSVADGAVLRVRDEDEVTLSKLRVSAIGAGTLENVILAEDGVLDVTDVPKGVAVVELPLKFVGTDPAAVGGWTFTVNGKPSGSWKLSVENGKLVLRRSGLILIFR